MRKIIFVAGEEGVGKSTFISRTYQKDEFHIVDLTKECKSALKSSQNIDEDLLMNTYNDVMGDMLDAFFEEKSLILEICVGTPNDSQFTKLVEGSKLAGITTELVMLTCDDSKREERLQGVRLEEEYFSSKLSTEHVLEIFEEFVKSIELSNEMGYI